MNAAKKVATATRVVKSVQSTSALKAAASSKAKSQSSKATSEAAAVRVSENAAASAARTKKRQQEELLRGPVTIQNYETIFLEVRLRLECAFYFV